MQNTYTIWCLTNILVDGSEDLISSMISKGIVKKIITFAHQGFIDIVIANALSFLYTMVDRSNYATEEYFFKEHFSKIMAEILQKASNPVILETIFYILLELFSKEKGAIEHSSKFKDEFEQNGGADFLEKYANDNTFCEGKFVKIASRIHDMFFKSESA